MIWENKELEIVEKNIGKSISSIVNLLAQSGYHRSREAVSKKKRKLSRNTITIVSTPTGGNIFYEKYIEAIGEPKIKLDDIYTMYDKDVEKKALVEVKHSKSSNIYRSTCKKQKYLHMCDLHIPFHLKQLVSIVEKESDKDTILILNGDLMDCYDVSVFPKSHSVGLKNEVAIFKKFLMKWSSMFKAIYITQGNHDFRVSSFLRKKISADVISLIPDDIIEIVLNDLKIPNIYYSKGDRNNWFIQIDNAIFAHPIDYKSGILGTSLMVMNYFDARNTDANVFVSAHSHAFGKTMFKGRVLVEGGCLCEEPDYSSSGKLSYTPQVNGYLRICSIDNKISFNDIELVQI